MIVKQLRFRQDRPRQRVRSVNYHTHTLQRCLSIVCISVPRDARFRRPRVSSVVTRGVLCCISVSWTAICSFNFFFAVTEVFLINIFLWLFRIKSANRLQLNCLDWQTSYDLTRQGGRSYCTHFYGILTYHLTELEENFPFQDVRILKILLTVLHCNNFDIILTLLTPYIGIVMVYWHCLQLTKLYANAIYVF